jgi:hypothetical protein
MLLSFSEVIGVKSLLFFVVHESYSYVYAYIVLNMRRASYDFVQSGSSERHNPGEAEMPSIRASCTLLRGNTVSTPTVITWFS